MESYTKPHRRHNPLTDEWVLVSPQRAQRPWQGQQEIIPPQKRNIYEQTCYLCPGNKRVGGHVNPDYTDTYVFENDTPALLPREEPSPLAPLPQAGEGNQKISSAQAKRKGKEISSAQVGEEKKLLHSEAISGTSRVLCFSPRHDLTLANMDIEAIEKVITLWQTQIIDLGKHYPWVQLFENKGDIMGCSAPHPHGQVWASSFIPVEAEKEEIQQKRYFEKHRSSLLLDYALLESQEQERTVCENNDWIVVVPYWATWPFETLLLPKFSIRHLPDLRDKQKHTLALIMKQLLNTYDTLFDVSFPYSMGWHGAPQNSQNNQHWQLHAHYYPPLLRSATVKKFMVGYEMLAEPQRDLTPEQAAKRLQDIKTS